MKMGRILAVCFAIGLAISGCGDAYQVVHAADQTIAISYDEPTTNADPTATPLTDLSHTNVYYSLNGGAKVKGPNVSASAATGGGSKTTSVLVVLPFTGEHRVELWATATDTSGNESAESNRVTKLFDFVPPSPPKNAR
jgi:hypothetical protein